VQLLKMIWEGAAGLGVGTVILKALFILVLGALFWVFCELIKYIVNIFSKLAGEALRYLAILVRGWPRNADEEEAGQAKGWSSDKTAPR